jgi:hypothetical protein
VGAIPAAWHIISHTQASTQAIEQILSTYSMKNEGSLAIDRYAKEHPFLSMFFASPVKHELELPSHEESARALSSGVTSLLQGVRSQSSLAAWWSWYLVNLSLLYAVTVMTLQRSFKTGPVIFSLATISAIVFVIGILAPAMVIWTAPSIPMESGKLDFVLQHQVRGIAAIIWELLSKGHGIVGGFLLLFSILTPLTKILLTLFVTESKSKALNTKIAVMLHSIGKWSMADVFVAGILLSLFALKAQEATKSIPCLGLYYFIGYCLLSMATTEILVHSPVVSGNEKTISPEQPRYLVPALLVFMFSFIGASTFYTYQQYSENMRQRVEASSSPLGLNNADLVLPAHK